MNTNATAFDLSTDPALLARIATLPPSFRWGVATSSYQIEGAVAEDGRTPSIWDTFSRVPGAVANGDHGDVACDHYHRMPQDVALIRDLGVDMYRFSVAWPRVQPGGRGPVNPAGLAFYDRLVDELLAAGVGPWVTLYHWDLPQELEDLGGWPARDTAYRFADYAMMVFDQLADRVDTWTTLNEPWCSAWLGYRTGAHAPGRRDLQDSVSATHHLLLGHGLATQRMRAAATQSGAAEQAARSGVPNQVARPWQFGITLNMATADPATDSELDREACRRADGMGLRLYLEPLRRGAYPADVLADLAQQGVTVPVQDGDLEVISTPFDVLGVNFYFGQVYSGTDELGNSTDAHGAPVVRVVPQERPHTAMDWPITPERFTELLMRLHRDYPGLPIFITENGAAFDDEADETGFVRDDHRTSYLAAHVAAVADARRQGADIRGYFAWSLLDNFEWAYGYDKRFGIVRVDYDAQARTPKQSARWLSDTMRRVRGGT